VVRRGHLAKRLGLRLRGRSGGSLEGIFKVFLQGLAGGLGIRGGRGFRPGGLGLWRSKPLDKCVIRRVPGPAAPLLGDPTGRWLGWRVAALILDESSPAERAAAKDSAAGFRVWGLPKSYD